MREECTYCGDVDTAEHTFFYCHGWTRKRERRLKNIEKTLTPDNMILEMVQTEQTWDIGEDLIKSIMSRKEYDERQKRNNNMNNI